MDPTRTIPGKPGRPTGRPGARALLTAHGPAAWLLLTWLAIPGLHASAGLQFDVFLGYGSQPTGAGGMLHEVGWFTVGGELHNPGPPFQAIFEITPGQLGRGQTHRLALELPTNTRKRFVLPVFAGGSYLTWNARLLDDRGRVRAELSNLRPQGVAWETLLLGALPRTFGGLPSLPQLPNSTVRAAQQPIAVRLLPEMLPDNPIALEGLDAIYLNSEKAAELKSPQAQALAQWLLNGGHLVLAIEDPADLLNLPSLSSLVPLDFTQMRMLEPPENLAAWGQPFTDNLERRMPRQSSGFPKYSPASLHFPDPLSSVGPGNIGTNSLGRDEFAAAGGTVRDGRVLLAADNTPLVVRAKRGRGFITLLTFSPEREPFRSWDRRAWFWARLLQLPPAWYQSDALPHYGGSNIDGVFGVLLDSRQIRSLPLVWLLLLLVVYLAVIGPIDRILLKRLQREMWTWITFPAYVVFFSLLIYYVGFRLRAGDTEWNELHLVDFLPRNTASSWRGRTYASLYSPVTARYPLASTLPNATLRGEIVGYAQPAGEIAVTHRDQGFLGEVSVPVWTSQLVVSDWSASNSPPFSAQLVGPPSHYRLLLENHLDRPLRELRLAFGGRMHDLGDLEAHARAEHSLPELTPRALSEFVFQGMGPFFSLVQQRQLAFGSDNPRRPEPNAAILAALSFVSHTGDMAQIRERQFVAPPCLDLSPLIDRGDAVVLAWVPDYAPVPTLRGFPALRGRQNTLFRLSLPLDSFVPSPP